MEQEIRLSSSEFKALASETRAGIIKLLRQRNHTLTEISKKLGLSPPTVKQHLGVLENAELIQELDEGRKWKYYMLTRKGKNIFGQESPVNIFIVLAVSVFSLCALMYSFISVLGRQAGLFASRQVVKLPAFIEAWDSTAPMETVGAVGSNATKQASGEALDSYIVPVAGKLAVEQLLALAVAIAVVAFIAGFLVARARR